MNACVELAAKIIEIQKLNRYKERLSVSPDVIEGGTTPNTICEEASVRIDMRYPTIALRDKTRKSLTQITDKVWSRPGDPQAQFESTILYEVSTQPMEQQFTRELNKKAIDIARTLDLNLEARPVGYLSDGNHIAEGQLKLLVGVGPYGGGMHTQGETMDRRSFAERARWLQALLTSGVLN